MAAVKVPANVELEDRLAFGLTGKQLLTIGASAVGAYGIFLLLAPLLPTPLALAAMLATAAAGVLLALVRRDGLAGDQLALAIARFMLAPKRRLLAPDGLPAPLRGQPRQPRCGPLDIPVRRILRSGLVELADGGFCQLLAAHATSFALRSAEEQAAFVACFARYLNALADPIQILIRSDQIDLSPQARQLEQQAGARTGALSAAARDHARFLRSLGEVQPLRRRQIVLVLHSRERQPELAEVALARRARQAAELLRGAEVVFEPLTGEQTAALLARSLDPPSSLDGSRLEGVIYAKPATKRQRSGAGAARPRRSRTAPRPHPCRPTLAADVRDQRLPA
jgi:PrgI family protein